MADRCGTGSLAAHHVALSRRADPGQHRRICRADPHSDVLGFQVVRDGPLTMDANSESFYAGALTRISRSMIVLALAFSLAAWFFYGWRVALGFACGCVIAYLNFHWLERVVTALARSEEHTSELQSRLHLV